jgi:hypothetical protein
VPATAGYPAVRLLLSPARARSIRKRLAPGDPLGCTGPDVSHTARPISRLNVTPNAGLRLIGPLFS